MATRQEVQELVGLVDRLERLLERSALSEIEVETAGIALTLRTPAAIATRLGGALQPASLEVVPEPSLLPEEALLDHGAHAIMAPLTGVFYRSPSPGAEPYVREGGQVNSGQVIGLIEAMKLFNEIKSDVTGTIRRVAAGDGDLVKAQQTLIEVDPT